jgi:hypothetical protein
MNRLSVVLLCALGVCLPFRLTVGAEARPEDAAQPVAAAWLKLVDEGKYVESWEKMSPGFKKEVSKRKWNATVGKIRKPLGRLTSRQLKSAAYSKDLPGAPEGEYVVLQFDSAFERKPAAREQVTLLLGQDLEWRVSSYAVK